MSEIKNFAKKIHLNKPPHCRYNYLLLQLYFEAKGLLLLFFKRWYKFSMGEVFEISSSLNLSDLSLKNFFMWFFSFNQQIKVFFSVEWILCWFHFWSISLLKSYQTESIAYNGRLTFGDDWRCLILLSLNFFRILLWFIHFSSPVITYVICGFSSLWIVNFDIFDVF